jgi:hypothetical protein
MLHQPKPREQAPFCLAPATYITQAALGTANFLLEGTTDAIFQVVKKGGLQEISNGNTHFSALLKHNFEHERSDRANNKPYGHYLANDAQADFQRARAVFNGERGPASFAVKTIDVGKNEAGTNKGIIQLNPEIVAHFSHHNQKPFQLGEVQRGSQQRVLHFLKHSGLAVVDLVKATIRGAAAIGIATIQLGKGVGLFLADSTIDIAFTLLKKGGLEQFAQRGSNIGEMLRHNYERQAQQIADKPYANILTHDAIRDLYSLITNLKSAVAFDSTETADQSRHSQQPSNTQSANDPVVTPTDPENATTQTPPPVIEITMKTPSVSHTDNNVVQEDDESTKSEISSYIDHPIQDDTHATSASVATLPTSNKSKSNQ